MHSDEEEEEEICCESCGTSIVSESSSDIQCEKCECHFCQDCAFCTLPPKNAKRVMHRDDYDDWVCIWCEYDMPFGMEEKRE